MAEATQETGLVKSGSNEIIRMGMDTVQGFEAIQRCAKLLSSSALVPEIYRGPNGLASCVIALNLATRIGADVLLVMQNLYIVKGKPGWSSKFKIATFNQCGRFSPIRYAFEGEQGSDTWGCRAWAIEKATNDKLVGPLVTIAIAKKEGWFNKTDSKWQSIPEQMLRWRSAGWFVDTIAPELAMGLPAADEIEDFVTLDAATGEVVSGGKGPRVVGTSRAESEPTSPLNGWTNEQLDDLEGLIEEIVTVMRSAGFTKESSEFEAMTRAKRLKISPDVLIPELRKSLEAMSAAPAPEPGASVDEPETVSTSTSKDGSLLPDPDAALPHVSKVRK